MTTAGVAPLLAVTLIFRSKPAFESLSLTHVVDSVTTFLDSAVELPIKKACQFNSTRLLDRIWDSSIELAASSDTSWSIRNLLQTETHYRGFQFTFSIVKAIQLRNLEMIQWLCEHFPALMVVQKCVEEAAAVGSIEILQYLLEKGVNVNALDDEDEDNEGKTHTIDWGYEDAAKAAAAGHSEVVMWLYENAGSDVRNDEETLKAVVASGDVTLLRWLLQRLTIVPCKGVHDAAANGHITMLEFLTEEGYIQDDTVGLLLKAADAGQMAVVRWIIDRDWSMDTSSDQESDDAGSPFDDDLHSRKHITSVGGEASLAIHNAAVNGHLDVAKYLHARVDWPLNANDETIELARHCPIIEQVKYLGLNIEAKRVSGATMLLATTKGLLDVVQWLYTTYSSDPTLNLFWSCNQDTKQHESVLDAAATNGHFEVLQYLHEAAKDVTEENKNKRRRLRKYPDMTLGQPIYMYPSSPRETELQTEPSKPGYTTAAMDGAAGNGHLNVLRWLLENESKGCTMQAMSLAARNGHFEVVQWLCDNIQKDWIASAMDSAASGGHIEILEWLHERGFQCSVYAMDGAASGGHLEAVKWLQDHRSEGCTKAAMDGAVSCGALRLVKWLHENRSEGCTRSAFYKAALLGHLDVIKWLLENYSEEFPPFAMENAALSLSFEVVLFLHRAKRGGCSSAAKIVRYLSLDMLRWLHENYREAMLENGGLL
ncbi:Ankyrin repeats domain-containing protein [Phytophthora infestans]|uniref:Ankyrin repeats domain-containing protein n=1 Tax=Phytophthora infestans TaxID=4787 RepID=A0A8S9V3I8_PHYIN|nr:Ankyrin repeats domain-containing protein [Phytophthora infestans]